MKITREWVEEQARLADAATEGPWSTAKDTKGWRLEVVTRGRMIALLHALIGADEDATHIAASRESVPTMAAALLRVLDLAEKWDDDVDPLLRLASNRIRDEVEGR